MSLVDSQPAVVAADQALADLAARRAQFEANVKRLAAEDDEARRVYDEALSKAMREGAPAPEPLRLRLNGEDVAARHEYISEGQRLTEARRQAVADAYPVVMRAARTQAIRQLKAAQPTVEKLAAQMASVAELLAAVRVCRDAANVSNPEGRRIFNGDRKLTVETFVALVASAGDPFDLVDLTGGRREPQTRDLGLVAGDVQALMAKPAA